MSPPWGVKLNIDTTEFSEKSMLKIIQSSNENNPIDIGNKDKLFQNIDNNYYKKSNLNTNNQSLNSMFNGREQDKKKNKFVQSELALCVK